jgi:pyruvate/2-oxoglutarate dehydrogenase complex dihydrolipoamide acyltransferase (E2) component
VQAGEAVARVVLVKSTLEVPAPSAGRLGERLVNAGDTFSRGQVLARITQEAP